MSDRKHRHAGPEGDAHPRSHPPGDRHEHPPGDDERAAPSPSRSAESRDRTDAANEFNPYDDRYTRGLIRHKVNQLVRRSGFHAQDREDLEQDFLARVVQSLPKFDPARGRRNAFVTAVVERYAANLVRDAQAPKRDRRRTVSLSAQVTVADEAPTELAQMIGDHEQDRRLQRERRSDEELTRLAMDLNEAMDELPELWRRVLGLRQDHSTAEVARAIGVPRTTVNHWMRRVREKFEDAGLRDYL